MLDTRGTFSARDYKEKAVFLSRFVGNAWGITPRGLRVAFWCEGNGDT